MKRKFDLIAPVVGVLFFLSLLNAVAQALPK
jgi:hypothetical protein